MARTVLFGIKLRGETSGFDKLGAAVVSVNQGLELAKKAIGGIKAVTVDAGRAILSFAQASARMSDAVLEAGRRTGTSAEFMSRMSFAAKQADVDIATFETGVTALTRRIAAMPDTFKKWGIAVRDAEGNLKSTDVVLNEVADRIQGMSSAAEKAALAQDLMSEAGRKLVPLLNGGSEGLAAFGQEADKLGITVSSSSAIIADEFNNAMGRAEEATNGLTRQLGGFLLPVLTVAADRFARLAGAANQWLQANQQLVQSGLVEFMLFLSDQAIPAVAAGMATMVEVFGGLASIVPFVQSIVLKFFAAHVKAVSSVIQAHEEMARAVGATTIADAFQSAREAVDGFSSRVRESAGEADQDLLAIRNTIERIKAGLGDMSQIGSSGIREIIIQAEQLVAELAAAGATGQGAMNGISSGADNATGSVNATKDAVDQLNQATAAMFDRQLAGFEATAERSQFVRDLRISNLQRIEEQNNRVIAANTRAAQEMLRVGGQVSSGLVRVFSVFADSSASTSEKVKRAFVAAFQVMGQTALDTARQVIIAQANQAAAGAAASQASLGPLGPVLAIAAASTIFGIVSAFAQRFQFGGEVQALRGAPVGRDNIPVLARAGDVITPPGEDPPGRGRIELHLTQNNQLFLPTEDQVDQLNRDQLMESNRRLFELGFDTAG
ncbi:MAG: hypothetical protein GTO22_14550 [Gemmatimonadales bacterium]|nr:hypothetical protein [Gemmatimonadales bacterium]